MFISLGRTVSLVRFPKQVIKAIPINRYYCCLRSKAEASKMRDSTELLRSLRDLMKSLPNNGGSIAAYVIPTDDPHQSEYISSHDERRAFISGFDGSAGTAVVTMQSALMWTDGRYFQQAVKQMDGNWTLMKDRLPTTPTIGDWLADNLKPGNAVGVDPRMMAYNAWEPIQDSLNKNGITLKPIMENLIDLIWKDQPPRPANPINVLELVYTGRTVGDKVAQIRLAMKENGANILVVTELDQIAWTLNLRGSDIDYNPVFYSYLIIRENDVLLFINREQLPEKHIEHFNENSVNILIHKYDEIDRVLRDWVAQSNGKCWISSGSSYYLNSLIPFERLIQKITPIAVMKAVKNPVELKGIASCHIRDGAALCQYFAWLEDCLDKNIYVDEITGSDKLEEFRRKKKDFVGLSFPTISGSGPNASVIHYHSTDETKRQITKNEIYLCDSGAQYKDGTTDVTRTIHFGEPTEFEKDCYTRVLKGQLSLGTTIFPSKIKGNVLDTLARKSLWDVGLDYGHGTGHGVGHFLNVHEGPMGIGVRPMPDDPGLEPNMILSNEPGYYEDGKFGIRIEDLVQIVPAEGLMNNFAGRGALTFHTLTMAPKQTKLIKKEMLTDTEKKVLNDYHVCVYETVSPILKEEGDQNTLLWLAYQTKPI